MHWADVVASELEQVSKDHVLATAITPSGPIHIGNLREILTTEAIYRSLRDNNVNAKLIYIGDTFDPLRKVYPFLPKSYSKFIGMPLSEIPCPCDNHKSYSDHFLEPFFRSLKELGVEPVTLYAHELYKNGAYNASIRLALDKASRIRQIIEKISHRKLPDNWMPFTAICSKCNTLTGNIDKYEYPLATYRCKNCNMIEEIDLRVGGVGKLPWRIDWPARWAMLNVSFEAFGKDHAASGGSWDTGKELVEQIFNHKPPKPLVYEFIQLKGKGAMHSSTGTAISADEILHAMPPEIIRFLFMKYEPFRHIDFDPGFGLLDLVDDYDLYEQVFFEVIKETAMTKESKRVYVLSQPNSLDISNSLPIQISYRHLVTLVQINSDSEEVATILRRNGEISTLSPKEKKKLYQRIDKVKYWLKTMAPEQVKFSLQEHSPEIIVTKFQKQLLNELISKLNEIDWTPENIHNTLHSVSKKQGFPDNASAKILFKLIYQIFLAKNKGPRAGYFLHSLGRDFVIQRINEYLL